MNGGQAELPAVPDTGILGCLLHPAIRRATGVRRWAARFRAWPTVADKPVCPTPAGDHTEPLSPTDEVSTLAPEAYVGSTDAPAVRPPL